MEVQAPNTGLDSGFELSSGPWNEGLSIGCRFGSWDGVLDQGWMAVSWREGCVVGWTSGPQMEVWAIGWTSGSWNRDLDHGCMDGGLGPDIGVDSGFEV